MIPEALFVSAAEVARLGRYEVNHRGCAVLFRVGEAPLPVAMVQAQMVPDPEKPGQEIEGDPLIIPSTGAVVSSLTGDGWWLVPERCIAAFDAVYGAALALMVAAETDTKKEG